MARQRIGIFCGSFDPFHTGHLAMAQSIMNAALLDRLLLMPLFSGASEPCVVPAQDRWKMLTASCACDERLSPSPLLLEVSGVRAVKTLLSLPKRWPRADLFCVIGEKSVMNIRHWPELRALFPLYTFLVYPRSADPLPSALAQEISRLSGLGARFIQPKIKPVPVSSEEIRAGLSAGREDLPLPIPVLETCRVKGLYGLSGRLESADRWLDRLFSALNPHRYAHSLSVAWTARRLALRFGLDPLRAEQAGLLHDCAKCLPLKEMQRIARRNALTGDETILESGALLHSVVGAHLAREDYGMQDSAVLEAIACHNTGLAGMSRLSMCVCLADSIEPLRDAYPLLDQVRSLAEHSLEQALLLSLEGTSDFVRRKGKYLHPRTRDTIAWLKTLPETRNPSV